MGEALARSGALSAQTLGTVVSVEGLVEPAVIAHPQVVRSGARLGVSVVDAALALDPPAHVVQELLAALQPRSVVALADTHCTPALLDAVADLVVADGVAGQVREAARWVLLRAGGQRLRDLALLGAAPEVGLSTVPGEVLTWLAAATSCPHLLAGLVEHVAEEMRPCVARFAQVAAAGGSPVDVFAGEVIAWVTSRGHEVADWVQPAGQLSPPTWAWVVKETGLEQVAAAALDATDEVHVRLQVLRHPHLAGGVAHERARMWFATAMGEPDAPDGVVVDRAVLVPATGLRLLTTWLAGERRASGDVAFAWATLRQIVDESLRPRARAVSTGSALVAAMQLACMDTPGGPVAGEAMAWVQAVIGRVKLHTVHERTLEVLTQVADVVHHGGHLGCLRVDDLAEVRSTLDGWAWLGDLVGHFVAGLPGVDDPAFVQGLLTGGDTFAGTLDDLVAVATALAA